MVCKVMHSTILAPLHLRWILKNKFSWQLVLDCLKWYLKLNNCFHRLWFLGKCLENDLIRDCLHNRVLSESEGRPLGKECETLKTASNGIDLPRTVKKRLSLGLKHPFRKKFRKKKTFRLLCFFIPTEKLKVRL